MSEQAIKKAGEIIKSKTAAENMGAGVALSLIDNEGYPTTSCISMSKADGIREILFAIGLSSNKAKRAANCNRAAVCIFDDNYEAGSYYSITLVGTVEILTDPAMKKEAWYEGLEEHFSGQDDEDFCVLRFTTKRYNIWCVGMEGDEATGTV